MRRKIAIGSVINTQGPPPSKLRYRLIDSRKLVHQLIPITRDSNHPTSVNTPIRVI